MPTGHQPESYFWKQDAKAVGRGLEEEANDRFDETAQVAEDALCQTVVAQDPCSALRLVAVRFSSFERQRLATFPERREVQHLSSAAPGLEAHLHLGAGVEQLRDEDHYPDYHSAEENVSNNTVRPILLAEGAY